MPRDDALLRRLLVLRFTYGERIDSEKAREFEERVKPRLEKLRAVGFWVAKRVVSDPKLLEMSWRDLAEKLLIEMFRAVDMEVPEWVKLSYEVEEDVYEDIREAIRSYLIKRINEEYSRFVGRVIVDMGEGAVSYRRSEVGFEERVRIVLENRLLPWAILRGEEVYFTTDFVRELRSVIGDVGGLKSIAELLGWEYSRAFTVHRKRVQAVKVHIDKLISFLKAET